MENIFMFKVNLIKKAISVLKLKRGNWLISSVGTRCRSVPCTMYPNYFQYIQNVYSLYKAIQVPTNYYYGECKKDVAEELNKGNII